MHCSRLLFFHEAPVYKNTGLNFDTELIQSRVKEICFKNFQRDSVAIIYSKSKLALVLYVFLFFVNKLVTERDHTAHD